MDQTDSSAGSARWTADSPGWITGAVLTVDSPAGHPCVTDDHAVNQLLQMLQNEPQADGCVMSLADSFTPEAQTLASNHGIALLTAADICGQVLALTAGETATNGQPE